MANLPLVKIFDSNGEELKQLEQWDVDRVLEFRGVDPFTLVDIDVIHVGVLGHLNAPEAVPMVREDENIIKITLSGWKFTRYGQSLIFYGYEQMGAGEMRTVFEVNFPVAKRLKPIALSDAEWERQQAEQERQSAEVVRIANEEARVEAEERRELLAQQMEQATAAAQNAIQRATLAADRANNAAARAETAATEAEAATVSANAASTAAAESAGAASTAATAASEAAAAASAVIEAATQAAQTANAAAERAGANADAAETAAQNANTAADRANAAADRAEGVLENFNEIYITALLLNHTMPDALRIYVDTMEDSAPLTQLTETFFAVAAKNTSETYISEFYLYSTSPSPVGSKKGENANLVCEPSTMATAGRDDYADLPLFACFDCNYTIDADTKEPVIHAIKDIYGEFSSAPVDSFVGVLQMTGWVRRTQDGTTKTVEYAAYRKEAGFKPLPEAVRARDNSVRPFVIHAKYAAGWNSQGKLSSVSGVMPMTGRPASVGGGNTSPSGQQTQWRRWGNQYTGSGICDQAFLQTMLEIKYANLGSPGIMAGCCTSTSNKTAAVSETGVRRILLTPEQASEYVVGSSVSLGSSQDRASTACYDVCGITRVAAVTSVTVNGVEYGAVELDASSPFDTVAGATYIIVHPWYTGATDEVKGNDGSPYDNLSGREPFKLQGIEVMNGTNEAAADTSAYLRSNNTTQIRVRRLAEGSYTIIGTVPNGGAATGWQYISELNWAENDPETYLCYTSSGATETTGYCSKWYQSKRNSAGERLYGMYPSRGYGAGSGLCTVKLVNEMTLSDYTYSCRACGTAGNRGKYTENTETLG